VKKTERINEAGALPKATTGRLIFEGEDFSALNGLLAQLRAASPSSTVATTVNPVPRPANTPKGKSEK